MRELTQLERTAAERTLRYLTVHWYQMPFSLSRSDLGITLDLLRDLLADREPVKR